LVNAPLLTSQSFRDPTTGVTITTSWVTSTHAAVTVDLFVAPLAIAVATNQPSYATGQTVSSTAVVTSGGRSVPNATVTFKVTKSKGKGTKGHRHDRREWRGGLQVEARTQRSTRGLPHRGDG